MSDRSELIAQLRAARKLVSNLAAKGANNWTMNVPARDDDTDIVLAGALHKAIAALEAKEPAKPVPDPPALKTWGYDVWAWLHSRGLTLMESELHELVDMAAELKVKAVPVPELVEAFIENEARSNVSVGTFFIAQDLRRLAATLTAAHEEALKAAREQGRREAWRLLKVRNWTAEMSRAWHTNIPDTVSAFDALIESAKAAQAEGVAYE